MLDHILIPLDGSLLAEEAIDAAKRILKVGGKFTLVEVVQIPDYWEFGVAPVVALEAPEITVDRFLSQARLYLERTALKLRAEGFQVDVVTKCGDPAAGILETATIYRVDAIAISTHGRSGLSRWLFGSVTARVLSAAPCAVFVVPSKQHSQAKDVAHATAQ